MSSEGPQSNMRRCIIMRTICAALSIDFDIFHICEEPKSIMRIKYFQSHKHNVYDTEPRSSGFRSVTTIRKTAIKLPVKPTQRTFPFRFGGVASPRAGEVFSAAEGLP